MKSTPKKPMFVTFKRSQDNYVAALNVDDLKWAVVHKGGKQVVDVKMSNHELTLDTNEAQTRKFERELGSRYHLVTVGKAISVSKTRDAYNTILKLELSNATVYVWPRGLSMVRVADNLFEVTLHSQDENNLTQVELDEVPSASEVAEVFSLLHLV